MDFKNLLARDESVIINGKMEKNYTQKFLKVLLSVFVLTFVLSVVSAGVCNDGIDNDGDGYIDALIELSNNDMTQATFGNDNPITIYNLVKERTTQSLVCPESGANNGGFLRSTTAGWNNFASGNQLHDTADVVCNLLGYREALSSECRDSERSGLYPNGKCNYHTPSDNCVFYWDGTQFKYTHDSSKKYVNSWITDLTCQGRLPKCSNGIDDDGDGQVDGDDDGCATPNDDDERQHDPGCETPTDNSEGFECEDGYDNDQDGLIDEADPGCWTDTSDPSTYDPELNDEGRADGECVVASDCGENGYTDNYCSGNAVYHDYQIFGCAIDKTCQVTLIPVKVSDCSNGCSNGACNAETECADGIDNDQDGLIDEEDPGCWDDTSDPSTYNEDLDDEGRADGECVTSIDCDENYYGNAYCSSGDVFKNYHTFSCTVAKTCAEDVLPVRIQQCSNGCFLGSCLPEDTDCEDNVDNDQDGLIDEADPGCWDDPSDSSTYNPDLTDEGAADVTCFTNSDCGSDQVFGGMCLGQDAYTLILRPTCESPGTGVSSCTTDLVSVFEESCAFGCTGGVCDDGDCNSNADCAEDFYSDPFCKTDNNVYRTFHDVSCLVNHICGESTSDELVEDCDYGCSDGACYGECLDDSDCGSDHYGDNYCGVDDNVYKDFFEVGCSTGLLCEEVNTGAVLVQECDDGCENGRCSGFNDQSAPSVFLLTPQDGSTIFGDVEFNYTASDAESGVKNCSLIINGVVFDSSTNIISTINTFVRSFPAAGDYLAKVGCYDNYDNYAESEEVTFTYGEFVCQVSEDCGDYRESYFCSGDNLMKEKVNPICSDNVCSSDITEELVRRCVDGCSNGHCKSDDGDDRRYDDDTNKIPIIQTIFPQNKTVEATPILITKTSPVLVAQRTTVINWWIVLIFVLILGIILLLILILISGFKK